MLTEYYIVFKNVISLIPDISVQFKPAAYISVELWKGPPYGSEIWSSRDAHVDG